MLTGEYDYNAQSGQLRTGFTWDQKLSMVIGLVTTIITTALFVGMSVVIVRIFI